MFQACALSVVAAALFGCACSPAGAACAGPTCGTGYECLANRCATPGGTPVPHGTLRVVLSPIALATLADHDHGKNAETTTVTLGGGARSDSALYLRFSPSYKSGADVAAAFLLLMPATGTESQADDVPLEVSPIATAWSVDSLARGERPKTSPPTATGLARTEPPTLVRIDVTAIVHALARAPADAGMSVTAPGSGGAGVTLVTAAADAPRLEVYLAQPSTSRTPW